jgi:hypothetical protein
MTITLPQRLTVNRSCQHGAGDLDVSVQHLVANFSGRARRARYQGRDYLVAPMTLINPGVEIALPTLTSEMVTVKMGHSVSAETRAKISATLKRRNREIV